MEMAKPKRMGLFRIYRTSLRAKEGIIGEWVSTYHVEMIPWACPCLVSPFHFGVNCIKQAAVHHGNSN